MNRSLKDLPALDRMLVLQAKHFRGDIEKRMGTYQELLLLSSNMVDALADHKEHHDIVQRWAALAKELI